ncbi:MAG TPA: PKD domain-containing protein [Conexibacter sp.]|nr:PKD domain-containing protein [Conexibacter sp.]
MRDRIPAFPTLLLTLLTLLGTAVGLTPAASAARPVKGYVASVVGAQLTPFDAGTGVFGTPLSLSGNPWGVAIAPDGRTAYLANAGTNTVTPIDTATDTPGTPIVVGNTPRTIGITPDGRTAYVADLGSGSVTPIDLATNAAGAPIVVGSGAHGIAISPDGTRVYVTDIFSDAVSVIDTATNAVVDTIAVANGPYTIVITPDGRSVYVTTLGGQAVVPIDTATDTAGTPIPIGAPDYGIGMAPDGATVYVGAWGTGTLVPIDTATNTAGTPLSVGSGPEGIAITPDGRTAWVADTGDDEVRPLDLATGTVGAATSVAQAPIGIAIAPDRSPTGAFTTSTDGLTAMLDASASSDPDGSVARYAWDFGDGQATTSASPIASHTYAQPGAYTVTLTVTDDEGCSAALVYTGQTASCTGSPDARAAHAVTVATPPSPAAGGSAPAPATPAAGPRQAIERFTLASRCVRRGRDGTARVGLRLQLALPGSISVEVWRAMKDVDPDRCPARDPQRHYDGKLRRVATRQNVATAASVTRHVTSSFALPPGLYRIGVRAYQPGGGLTRTAHRWVRVLARPHAR